METDFWNNFWMVVVGSLSLGTSIVAIVLAFRANKQTEKQIKISSKQHLFDEKVALYLEIEKCIMGYKSFKVNLEKEKNEKNDSEYDDA